MQWEAALLRLLQETKASLAQEAHKGRPTLYPFLCLLSEQELVRMLLQVGVRQAWQAGRGAAGNMDS